MENASKALIIAGAILLSIAIIGLGMAIFNSVKDTSGGDEIKDQKILTYNQKFEQYEGTRKGSEVRTLISAVIAANGAQDDNITPPITLGGAHGAGASDAKDMSGVKAGISATGTYTVTLEYSTTKPYTGYVCTVNID